MSRPVLHQSNKYLFASGLVVLVAGGALFPYWYSGRGVHIDRSKSLPDQAAVRGAYINSGSKDVGPDPKAGAYNVRKGGFVCVPRAAQV